MVAPLAGAWIEIDVCLDCGIMIGSLPSRERGLKFHQAEESPDLVGRSPRGSVD